MGPRGLARRFEPWRREDPAATGAIQTAGDRDLVSERYSRLALLVVVTGVLIKAVDTTIVVLALPEIQRSLQHRPLHAPTSPT